MLHAGTGYSPVPPKVTGPILEREAADQATKAPSIARRRTETWAGRRRTEPSTRLSVNQRSNRPRSINVDDKSSVASSKARAGIHPRKRAFTRPHQNPERTLKATLSRFWPSPSVPEIPSRKSSSDCTITQQGYNSRPLSPDGMGRKSKPVHGQAKQRRPHHQPTKLPNALDYLDRSAEQEAGAPLDLLLPSSSSSSHEDHSDADVSELASTPSSESTPPSPTSTEGDDEARMENTLLRSNESTRSTEDNMSDNERLDPSPELQASVKDGSEDEHSVRPPSAPSVDEHVQYSKQDHQPSPRYRADSLRHDHDVPQPHMSYAQRGYAHCLPPMNDHQHPFSIPWSPPPHPLYFHQTPPLHYPWPSPSATTVPTHTVNDHTMPPASRCNGVTGTWPQEAVFEPSKPNSATPLLYRKFTRLTHRILLSLQDDLLDLETRLQRFDEALTTLQRATSSETGSRNAHQPEWHYRHSERDMLLYRAQLLPNIEAKIERYHRLLSASADVFGSTSPATPEQIEAYKQWIRTHHPSSEERLLADPTDLIALSTNTQALPSSLRSNAPTTIFALLVLLYTTRAKSRGLVLVLAGIVVLWPCVAAVNGPRFRMGVPARLFAGLGALVAVLAVGVGVV